MSENKKENRKRKKQFYIKAAAAKRGKIWQKLDAGMQGVLITCNNREKEAVREAYNVLNEYADKLIGPEKTAQGKKESEDCDENTSDEEEDYEKALKQEVDTIKDRKPSERRFQSVQTGANNCIFIKSSVEDTNNLVHGIFSDILEKGQSKSRFIMRFLPVQGTCKANEEKISKLAEELFHDYFHPSVSASPTYNIMIKVRNNNTIGRAEILPALNLVMEKVNLSAKPEFTTPDFVINVDVIKTFCCISIVQDFFKFRKYNLQEVAAQKIKQNLSPRVEKPTSESLPEDKKEDTVNEDVKKEITKSEGDENSGEKVKEIEPNEEDNKNDSNVKIEDEQKPADDKESKEVN